MSNNTTTIVRFFMPGRKKHHLPYQGKSGAETRHLSACHDETARSRTYNGFSVYLNPNLTH